jgi:hypothetical protein
MVSQLKIWKILVLEKVVVLFGGTEAFYLSGLFGANVRNGKQSNQMKGKSNTDVQEVCIWFLNLQRLFS